MKEEVSNCCGWSMTNDFCNKCNDHCSPLTEEELKELDVEDKNVPSLNDTITGGDNERT